MKNWQGIPTTGLTLGGEVMVPRDNSTLALTYQAFYSLKHYNLLETGSFLIRKLSQP